MKRVEVRWVDSVVGDRWMDKEAVKDRRAGVCVSVGFLVDENPDAITLAQSTGEGEDDGVCEYGNPLTIPTVALLGEPVVLHSGRIDWGEDIR